MTTTPKPFKHPMLKVSALALSISSTLAGGVSYAAELEEVIVISQKIEKTLQNVAASVSVVTGEKITAAGINDLQALSGHVPGLQIGQGALSDNIYIRGIGSGLNRSFDQSVGMYIDGISMPRAHQYRSPFLDVEQVEVLKGPQGVLFGKNTVAGVVNITTAVSRGGDEFVGKISAAYEPSVDGRVYTAIVGGSITDAIGARLTIKDRKSDGTVHNSFLNEDAPESDETTIRLTLAWDPSETLSAVMKYTHIESETTGTPTVISALTPPTSNPAELRALGTLASAAYTLLLPPPGVQAALGGYNPYPGLSNAVGRDFTSYNNGDGGPHRDGLDLEVDNVSLEVNWDISDDYKLTSVTGYSEYEYDDGLDSDFLPISFINTHTLQEFEQFSQEFRLEGYVNESFSWIAGVYFEEQDLDTNARAVIDGTLGQGAALSALLSAAVPGTYVSAFDFLFQTNPNVGVPYRTESIARFPEIEQESSTRSIFWQGTWSITDTVRATFGVRYAQDEKDAFASIRFADDFSGIGINPPSFDNVNPAQPLLNGAWASITGTFQSQYNGSRKENHTTSALTVEWDLNDDILLYVSYSEGYKSGGFDGSDNPTFNDTDGDGYSDVPSDAFEFEDEEVKTFEIGGKMSLADNSMRLNWAAFYTDYSDLQVTSFAGAAFVVDNAAETDIMGFEFDYEWQATNDLYLGANFAYLDYEYGEFEGASCSVEEQLTVIRASFATAPGDVTAATAARAGCQANREGETGVFAPEISASLYAEYSKQIGDSLILSLGADANFKDEYFTDDDFNEAGRQGSTWKYNIRVGLSDANEKWAVMLYGNNITDEQTLTYSVDTPLVPGGHASYVDQGVIWGLRASYNF